MRAAAAGVTDLNWWRREYDGIDWRQVLGRPKDEQAGPLRRCTYAGRPFGDEVFVQAVSERFGRHWQRGRPKRERAEAAADAAQLALFGKET